ISNRETFDQATKFAKGAIIGSGFIKHLSEIGSGKISEFVGGIR
ncbi:tryptophan synthase subunit alpha, partial [Flavobacterium circumlabens]